MAQVVSLPGNRGTQHDPSTMARRCKLINKLTHCKTHTNLHKQLNWTHLVTCEHVDEMWEGQHEVVVDAPAVATACVSRKQGRQEVGKSPGPSLLIGYAELVQGLH